MTIATVATMAPPKRASEGRLVSRDSWRTPLVWMMGSVAMSEKLCKIRVVNWKKGAAFQLVTKCSDPNAADGGRRGKVLPVDARAVWLECRRDEPVDVDECDQYEADSHACDGAHAAFDVAPEQQK